MARGPKVEIKRSCFECDYVRSEHYAVQGDSGCDVYCTHGGVSRRIGDTTWETPAWCPFMAAPPSGEPGAGGGRES